MQVMLILMIVRSLGHDITVRKMQVNDTDTSPQPTTYIFFAKEAEQTYEQSFFSYLLLFLFPSAMQTTTKPPMPVL
jgi:hypothetical protein